MRVIELSKRVPQDFANVRILGHLVNSSGSVGANYREANEALSRKDFLHRLRITRKECKESSYWLELVQSANPSYSADIDLLIQESKDLRNIFTSIIAKVS